MCDQSQEGGIVEKHSETLSFFYCKCRLNHKKVDSSLEIEHRRFGLSCSGYRVLALRMSQQLAAYCNTNKQVFIIYWKWLFLYCKIGGSCYEFFTLCFV